MEAFKLARELAQALLDSDAFRAYQEAEIEALNDEELQKLLWAIQELEESKTNDEHLLALQEKLAQMPRFRAWQRYREQFDQFVTLVLDQISYYVSATLRTDVPCGVSYVPPLDMLQQRPFQLARELASILLDSAEYRAYQEAEHRFLTDDNVLALIEQLRKDEALLRSFNYGSAEDGAALRARIEASRRELVSRPTYAEYMATRQAFDRLLGMILDTVSLEITGGGRPASGCGTTGSNCGCGSGINLPPPQRIKRTLAGAFTH